MIDFEFNRPSVATLRSWKPQSIEDQTLQIARTILDDIAMRGDRAVLDHAARFGEVAADDSPILSPEACRRALDQIPKGDREVLERTACRIRSFARAQRESIGDCSVEIIGGRVGHSLIPVDVAGCYAPGGRYPLPSSVLMTAITAKVAGVRHVIVASPKPTTHTLAAACIAGADQFLAVGGAHAVGALALGRCGVPRCDMIVGPGNRFVTAAKYLVSSFTGIDMLAGPSELLVMADAEADPDTIAADLLAQAEHDSDARVMLITMDAALIPKVQQCIRTRLLDLPTASVAMQSLKHAIAIVVCDEAEAVAISDEIAPEHLHIHMRNATEMARRVRHAGGVFIGSRAAEVLGDYGAGPNHTLPTGGSARYRAGLSVFTFLRARTFIEGAFDRSDDLLLQDVAALARMESLEAHARAADLRRS